MRTLIAVALLLALDGVPAASAPDAPAIKVKGRSLARGELDAGPPGPGPARPRGRGGGPTHWPADALCREQDRTCGDRRPARHPQSRGGRRPVARGTGPSRADLDAAGGRVQSPGGRRLVDRHATAS